MLDAGFCALSLAVGLGLCLLAGRLRKAALLHGAAGLAGLLAVAFACWRGTFTGPFALDALVLLAAAFSAGLWFHVVRRRRAPPGLAVLLHGMAGGLAFVLLAGFVL